MNSFLYTRPTHRDVLSDPYTELLVRKYECRFFDDLMPPGFEKQRKTLDMLTDQSHSARFFLFGGAAGGGKSFLGWIWLLMNCLAYPDTAWFFSREELKDARKFGSQTYREVIKKLGLPKKYFKFDGKDNFIYCYPTESHIYMLSAKKNPRDQEFTGLGSTLFTGGMMEECGQHPSDGAFQTLKSRINRYKNDKYGLKGRIFKTANPSKNYLYKDFYLPAKAGTLEENKIFVQALVTDNPGVTQDYIDALDDLSKDKKQRLRHGNWEYDDDESILINYDAIQALWSNNFVRNYKGGNYITADIALHGSDKFVVGVWEGFTLVKVKVIAKCDSKEVEKTIRELAKAHSVPQHRICYDGDGLGSYLRGYMQLAKPFINNSKPVKAAVEGDGYGNIKEEYGNLKDQCYFRLAKAIVENKIYIQCDLGEYKQMLIEELEVIKNASYGTDNKLKVLKKQEVKEIIGRSPDLSDMLMMRMYFTLKINLSHQKDIAFFKGNLKVAA